jgi:hypothetical protein
MGRFGIPNNPFLAKSGNAWFNAHNKAVRFASAPPVANTP